MNYSRRVFIDQLKTIAGGTALATALPWATALYASPKQTAADSINIGVIGAGGRGRYLIKRLLGVPGVNLVAVCDDYQPHLQQGKALAGSKAVGYTDYRKVLDQKDIDAVVIATPLYWHKTMTVEAFEAGKHVFCEKAMAMNVTDCTAMVSARKRYNKVLQIGHQRMFDPMYLEAMQLVKKNALGNITQLRAYWHRNDNWRRPVADASLERKINWRLYRDYSRGLLSELGTHHFQLAYWIMGELPVAVSASGGLNYWKDGREVYDNVNVIFEYANGTHFIYDSMIANKKYGVEFQLMGSLGTMELETGWMYKEGLPTGDGAAAFAGRKANQADVDAVSGATWDLEKNNKKGRAKILDKENLPDANVLQLEAFVQSVREGKHLAYQEDQAYKASLMAMYAYRAMMEKKRVIIPKV